MSNRCWFAIIRGTTYFMLKGSASWQGKEATNVIVVNKPDPLGDKVIAHNEVSILELYDSDPNTFDAPDGFRVIIMTTADSSDED